MNATLRIVRAAALATSMAAISAYGSLPAAAPMVESAPPALARPNSTVPARLDLGPELAGFYRERDFNPVWLAGGRIRPEARRLLAQVTPNRQLVAAIRAAESGDRYALTRADLLLTKAYSDHVAAVQAPPTTNGMQYVDDELRPGSHQLRASLDALASAPDLGVHLQSVASRNPAFDGLRRGLLLYRARWAGLPQHRVAISGEPGQLQRRLGIASQDDAALTSRLRDFQRVHGLARSGRLDAPTLTALNRGAGYYERLIEENIERARAIPPRPIGRYILVDTASAQLWLIENGQITDRMRVIVGKANMQTPVMAGMMDHVVLNPYWNLPPDLIRQRARGAVRRGAAAIAKERLQVLSDWSDESRILNPRNVNWASVASGHRYVNLRQLPGPQNMMGAIKFMFPNELGIYLHDTPFKQHFQRSDRRISSGCVRVEDAGRLARWIFHGAPPSPSGAPEQEVDLPEPIPVYISYLTALPTHDGVVFQPDGYERDRISKRGSGRSREAPARLGRPV